MMRNGVINAATYRHFFVLSLTLYILIPKRGHSLIKIIITKSYDTSNLVDPLLSIHRLKIVCVNLKNIYRGFLQEYANVGMSGQ